MGTVRVANSGQKAPKRSTAQRYYDFLKCITLYQTPAHLREHSEREWGLPYAEALECAYENVINDAKRAIRGKRRPK